jgi:4-hydroxy-3-methylbut-2-enyl diphosphate reductase
LRFASGKLTLASGALSLWPCIPVFELGTLALGRAMPPCSRYRLPVGVKKSMKIILASPRGFCAGVNMAIESLEMALKHFATPIYVYHEIVHNRYVVDSFRQRGVVFVDSLEEVPAGSTLMFSAHGVSPEIRRIAKERQLTALDATCPLVTKVHLEAIKYAKDGYNIILIGHEGHDEVIGTMGEAPESITLVETEDDVAALPFTEQDKLAYLTQTTLSVDDANRIIRCLRERFPHIASPPKDDICYATQNRQEAIRILAPEADLCLVVGSQNSSNSQRLAEIAAEYKIAAYLLDGPDDLSEDWFAGVENVLISAGASAPEHLVEAIIDQLTARYGATVEVRTIRREEVTFPLPKLLRQLQTSPPSGNSSDVS